MCTLPNNTKQMLSVTLHYTTGNLCRHYRYYYFTVMALQVLLFLHPSNNYCLGTTGIITALSRHYRYYYFSVLALQVISVGTTGIITSVSL